VIFQELNLPGLFLIEPELVNDERGFFTRTWSKWEFCEHGLNPQFVESSCSFNTRKGTLRGMHFQRPPHAQAKLVRCTAGSIYDVALDLRADSPTFKQWQAVELTATNRLMLFIPEGFAHGFQTLEDNTEVLYQMGDYFDPELSSGVRWDDPTFGIEWPGESNEERVINQRDRELPDFPG